MEIRKATSEAEIQACFRAMQELRPHLSQDDFVAQVLRQMKNHGYTLVYVAYEGQVVAAAGYRVAEYLAWGKALYVDDLATHSETRKLGYGGKLLDWLLEQAVALGCAQFHLDSGVHRHDAHRLYLGRKLQITSHHFAKKLSSRQEVKHA